MIEAGPLTIEVTLTQNDGIVHRIKLGEAARVTVDSRSNAGMVFIGEGRSVLGEIDPSFMIQAEHIAPTLDGDRWIDYTKEDVDGGPLG